MPLARPFVACALLGAVAASAFLLGQAQATSGRGERRRTAVATAVAHAAPAVVSVDALRNGRRASVRASGAGVIVHPDGYVVTNSHVVSGAQSFRVELFGGRGTFPAALVADDPSADLAVLKLEGPGPWRHVSLCPTRDLMLGETAIAIGNPHGLGDTITVGVVSATGRQAKMATGVTLRDLVQTDASINTGNSGGALLNLDGELIGINVSLLPSAEGIAFAICADQVAAVVQRATGRRVPANPLPESAPGLRPAAGLAAPDLAPSPALGQPPAPSPASPPAQAPAPLPAPGGAQGPAPAPRVMPGPSLAAPPPMPRTTPLRPEDLGLSLADDGARVLVTRVDRGSAASISGLQVGDTLLFIDGRPVEAAVDLLLAFSSSRPGREYSITVRRGAGVLELVLVAPR
ncbi:MAG: S1C family serine protease [Planctomycetia bacterium]